jgi:ATP-binding cassette, subfamily C, bacterial exporter for protease/lipase
MKKNTKILRDDLSSVLWSLRREFAVVGIFSMVVNLLMLTPTIYMLQVYDRVLLSQNHMTLLAVSLICLFLFAVMAFSEWSRSILLVRTGVKLDQLLSHRVFKGTFLAYLNPSDSSPAKAFSDLTAVRQFLTGNGVFAFFDSPWVPIYIGVLFLLHPWLGWAALFFAVVQASIAWFGHRLSKQVQLTSSRSQAETQGFLGSKMRNVDVLVSMGMLGGLYRRWQLKQHKTLVLAGQAQDKTGSLTAVSKFVRYTQQSFSLGIGALLVVIGEISPGAMIAANVLMTRALAPIDLLVSTWPSFLTTKDAFERLRQLLMLSPAGRTEVIMTRPLGKLTVENVVISLPGREVPVVNDVSFTTLPGTVTVVLGPSGSGKSTLARAMMGIGPVLQSGRVLLDDTPITDWTRESLGPFVGYLPQDIELFDGTVAENIARIGQVDSGAVIAAAEAAGLHQMILRFPKGYDTPMGQAGQFLSGGQRQRVGLARALYGNPALLVLDEPNANLDDEGEKALLNAMQLLKNQGASVVLISHRPGVLAVADRVVILQDGKLVASGPRDAVLEAIKKQKEAAALAASSAPSAGLSA